ncbi:MAG: DUF692 family protein, partial [Bacteriovoracaceae bacterium]|nr:DUF692 family protein [Bacteriovoracaceae bacterium]
YGMPVDTHANNIWPEVWELFENIIKKVSPQGVIIERDSNLPNFSEMNREIKITKQILSKNGYKIMK